MEGINAQSRHKCTATIGSIFFYPDTSSDVLKSIPREIIQQKCRQGNLFRVRNIHSFLQRKIVKCSKGLVLCCF
jgi:hypothetical protein